MAKQVESETKKQKKSTSIEISMVEQTEFDDKVLEQCLRRGEIKASEKMEQPPQVLWVGECVMFMLPFTLKETEQYLQSKGIEWSRYDIAECYMIMGGIPFYLKQLSARRTLTGNIDNIFFKEKGLLWDEFTHLYNTLFKHPESYISVVEALAIKRILKEVGITRLVTVLDPKTRKAVQVPIYEVAASHLARRTFIGNVYKQVHDPALISSLTGHSERSTAFQRYRHIDDDIKREVLKYIQ